MDSPHQSTPTTQPHNDIPFGKFEMPAFSTPRFLDSTTASEDAENQSASTTSTTTEAPEKLEKDYIRTINPDFINTHAQNKLLVNLISDIDTNLTILRATTRRLPFTTNYVRSIASNLREGQALCVRAQADAAHYLGLTPTLRDLNKLHNCINISLTLAVHRFDDLRRAISLTASEPYLDLHNSSVTSDLTDLVVNLIRVRSRFQDKIRHTFALLEIDNLEAAQRAKDLENVD